MTEVREFTYPSSDGVHQIHAVEWVPDGPPRAVVQIAHGISEYIGRYDHVARFLAGHGFLVCGNDHLGHGQTASKGGYGFFAAQDGWTLAAADVHHLTQLQHKKWPGVPYFLLGHSMGSFLARTCLCRYPGSVDGAILSGTGQEAASLIAACKALTQVLCRTKGPRFVSPLVYALSIGNYNKPFNPARTPADWISRDEAVVDAYMGDPLCTFIPTVSLFRDMMGGLQYIVRPASLGQMKKDTPVYFLSGDRDPVGAMGKGVEKVAGLFRDAGCTDVTVKLYPGGRHEMFNETNKDEVLADLLAWLESKL